MSLITPNSIKLEHDDLHKELSKLLKIEGKIGSSAKKVANALHKHFVAEESYAMPPLGALFKLSIGEKVKESKKVINLSEKLEKNMPLMLKEHKEITTQLEALKVIAKKEKNKEALEFVKRLKLHAQNEEEILYPTAILIGKYLKLISK